MNEKYQKKLLKEKALKGIFFMAALFSIVAAILIFGFLIAQGFPAIKRIGLSNFLFSTKWDIKHGIDYYTNEILQGSYGIATSIVGTIYVTLLSIIFGGVIGVLCSIFISKFCPNKIKKILIQLVNLLAGIPSVIYGFFGLIVIQPLIGRFSQNGSGTGLLSVAIVLTIMILPTIVSLSRNAIDGVPKEYYEGARALGDTHIGAILSTVVPAAKSGIMASLILGIGRAMGETMAVAMLCGNATVYPKGLFGSFSTMTSHIVNGLGELNSNQVAFGAMVGTGCVLLVFVIIINLLFQYVFNRKENYEKKRKSIVIKNKIIEKALYILSIISTLITVVSLISIVVYVIIRGLPHLTPSLFSLKSTFSGPPTIMPSIVSTLLLVAVSILISVPLGVAAAIYLNEYVSNNNIVVKIIRMGIETLTGIPSIIYALFGSAFFCIYLKLGVSIIAGALTISIMIIPVIIKASEEALRIVPNSYREGSFALGAGKARTIFKTVLPSALPGILSAIILAMGRIISESAPLLFTMGGGKMVKLPASLSSSGTSLAVLMYSFSGENKYMNECWATASILIIIVLLLNILSTLIVGKLQIKLVGKE